MLDTILHFFLMFSKEAMILPIIIIGYTLFDRRKWGTAIYIMLFTMTLSQFLKNIWQIPLKEHLGNGYAFPSGHMQFTLAFYGWVAMQSRKTTTTLICLFIIIGVGCALIHFNYHDMRDILGAIGFGALSLVIYKYLLDKFFTNIPEIIGFLLAVIGIALMYFIPATSALWLAEGALVGFSLGWTCAKNTGLPTKLWHKILSLIITAAGIVLIKFTTMQSHSASASIIFITYALVGMWIAIAPYFSAKLCNGINKLKSS